MREKGIDAANVNGTGRDGRITKEDAQNATAPTAAPATLKSEDKPAPAPKKAPATAFTRDTRTEKMSRMRRTIATRLVKAKNETAMLTTFNEVDLSAVMAMRSKVQEKFVAKNGVKLGFMSLFAKACARVLMDMPNVNAQLGADGKSLIYHDFVDISFAISTPTGLVVPPIRNVESLDFADVELELKSLAKKARANELTIEEMQGGTFTITNGGVFGSMMSTPIINEPQSAILGMHNIIQRPVAVNGEVVIRPMMYIAMSYDHRVIDGSSSVTFLVKVKELLEDPTLLLLGL
jgi:2-oxoglutarate dehydrogenase E2 component (dihydrolipoamide succinyltransferase)